jgi:Metallo-peptidase family M12B Reprolysin-like/HYR domain
MLNETLGRRRVVLFSCLVSAALLFGASPVVLAASPDPPGRREGARGLWTALDGPESAVGAGETVARRYRLDLDALDVLLARAGREGARASRRVRLTVPDPAGSFLAFLVDESPVMEPELARKFPEIRTYRGQGIAPSAASLRLGRTPLGFQATVVTADGVFFVAPENPADLTVYTSVRADALAEGFECLLDAMRAASRPVAPEISQSGNNTLRTYRLAVAATGEYTQFYGSVANALAAITNTVNGVNAIYNVDIASRLVLIGNENLVIYPNPATDPFPLTNKNTETQAAIDAAIGSANYDIGHLFHVAGASISGNAGCIGCVCTAGAKGSGWSQGPNPSLGTFTFLAAHEMGHQHGANHTWNGPGCGPETSPARYEPGSGTTIMSYSSICGSDNIQGGQVGDLYFHAGSRAQITAYMAGGGACGTVSNTGNNAPSASAGADYQVPRGTPFVLTASGSDPDGNALTYTWEQYDIGPNAALNAVDDGQIPLFRSRPPSTSGARTFPLFSDLLAGSSNLFPNKLGEQLPSTDRTLTFRTTARDNVAGGGGANDDEMKITVLGDPFQVTSPTTGAGAGLECGTNDNVTWNVGGGSVAATVDIRLSTDGGASFPTLLAAGTANDGTESVAVPKTLASNARVRIDSVGNVFFALSPPTAIEDTLDPTIQCPPNVVVECTGNNGIAKSDPQLAAFFAGVSASDACDSSVSIANNAPAFLPVGPTNVTFTATDDSSNSADCVATITVADTQAPTIAASVSPDRLWPPNHKLVDIAASVVVADVCNPSPTFVLTSVTSNEPDNGTGDGDTVGDIQDATLNTPDVAFKLRAERSGNGSGRVYTVKYTASDGHNTTQATDTVVVPHSKKK